MESCAQKNIKGFTLIEMVVVLGITALLMGAITEIFLISFRSRNIVFDQLTAQGDGRRAVDGFINTAQSFRRSPGRLGIRQLTSTRSGSTLQLPIPRCRTATR
jgi:prepilin-type N-terminal cleavage/methylation domain-containing protein